MAARPTGWPGKPLPRRAKAPFAALDDEGRSWLSDALDLVTVDHDARQAKTDRRVILLAFQHVERNEGIGGRPFASLSVKKVARELHITEPTARASLLRLSQVDGPLEVVAKPKAGESWGTCYAPRKGVK